MFEENQNPEGRGGGPKEDRHHGGVAQRGHGSLRYREDERNRHPPGGQGDLLRAAAGHVRLHHVPARPSRLLRVQVHPVRPGQRGAAVPVAASPGKQGRAAEDPQGETPAAVRDHQAASQGSTVLQAQRQLHPDLRRRAKVSCLRIAKLGLS